MAESEAVVDVSSKTAVVVAAVAAVVDVAIAAVVDVAVTAVDAAVDFVSSLEAESSSVSS